MTDADGTGPHRWERWLGSVVVVGIALLGGTLLAGPAAWSATTEPSQEQLELGRELYQTACVSCHGEDGDGVAERGPTILDEGGAGVHFVMTTGRMPLAAPDQQGVRGPVRYSDEEIRALVAYVEAFPGQTGPPIPDPSPGQGDAARGGAVFRSNCATCHQAAGQGGALVASNVPSLSLSTPTQVAEAMIVGPGAMPVFEFDDETVDDVTAYVESLQEVGDPGGFGLGNTGPFAEGLVAWGVGLVALLVVARWIGTRMQ